MKCLFPIWGNMMGKIHTRGMRRTNESFSNAAPPAAPYQAWSGYPDSPFLTADFPYQFITLYNSTKYLNGSTVPLYYSSSYSIAVKVSADATGFVRRFDGVIWKDNGTDNMIKYKDQNLTSSNNAILESNCDIYANSTLTTVYFAKTTP